LTVQEVIDEVKDKISSMKLSGLNFKVAESSLEAIKEIKKISKETGDLDKLSNTDLKVLSLAKEKNYAIISDDRNVQNVAEKIGIKYISIFNKKITKLINWKKFCKNCKNFYNTDFCPICGSKLIRVAKGSENTKSL
jgi:UPF0271 protein